jgi:uncharacterized protein YjbJ (UPF0337 family)
MRASRLLLAGIGVGAALTYALFYDPSLKYETGFDGVEDTANRARRWGAKKRFGAGADLLKGRMKEGIGRVTGDDDLAAKGVADQAVGAVKNTAGKWGHAVGETIHDLNRWEK